MADTRKIAPQARHYETLEAAAQRLACSERTVRRLVASGELTAYRIGKRLIRLDSAEVDAKLVPVPTFRGDVA